MSADISHAMDISFKLVNMREDQRKVMKMQVPKHRDHHAGLHILSAGQHAQCACWEDRLTEPYTGLGQLTRDAISMLSQPWHPRDIEQQAPRTKLWSVTWHLQAAIAWLARVLLGKTQIMFSMQNELVDMPVIGSFLKDLLSVTSMHKVNGHPADIPGHNSKPMPAD